MRQFLYRLLTILVIRYKRKWLLITVAILCIYLFISFSFSTGDKTSQAVIFPYCPDVSPHLIGHVPMKFRIYSLYDVYDSALKHSDISEMRAEGGHYRPRSCIPLHKVAIIVPYRDREKHLRAWLHHYHPIWKRQLLDYQVFVLEQVDGKAFNRAMLFNVGFTIARRVYDWDCYVFHDVDIFAESDYNLYTCPESPRHMSGYLDKFKYKLDAGVFGGIVAMSEKDFIQINGFSNMFWGWGGEDDDLRLRVLGNELEIIRHPEEISHMKMWPHRKAPPNPKRWSLIRKTEAYPRSQVDGLTSMIYSITEESLLETHYHLKVKLKINKHVV